MTSSEAAHVDPTHAHGPHAFPSTIWSQVLATGRGPSRDRLGELAERYWWPVHAYVRARWGRSHEDATDLTQEFFAWILERDWIDRADPGRGRFRAFVKTSLENFLTDETRRAGRLKRGGDRAHLSLSADDRGEPPPELVDVSGRAPEDVLDDAWRRALVERATELLEAEYERVGKPRVFAVFRAYFLDESDDSTYADLAERHGIRETDVSNDLQHAKRRYREVLRRVVLDTVADPAALADELEWLFGGA